MYDIKEIERYIQQNLSSLRYQHTMRVAEEAKHLAKHYGIDIDKAYIAGLLHDIAKECSEEENKMWIEKYQLPRELLKEEYKNIIHADIGAIVAKEYYGVSTDICNAIKYHTIGNKNMDILAKIILVSDKIGRKNLSSKMKEAKRIAYQDLDKAMCLIFENEEEILRRKSIMMHPDTIELLKFINDKRK